MIISIITFIVLFLILYFIYSSLEVTPIKYGVLNAMAAQSKEVSNSLDELLKTKDDFKILNKDFKRLEKVYLTSLNLYLFQFRNADNITMRRELLESKNFDI